MDVQQKLFVTCLLLQTGFIVWVTCGERAKNALIGNLYIGLWLVALMAFAVYNIGTATLLKYKVQAFIAVIGVTIYAGFANPRKKFEFRSILENYAPPLPIALAIIFFVASGSAENPEALIDRIYSLGVGSIVLSIMFTAGLLAALPGARGPIAFLLGWIFPGAGHLFLGRRNKAIFFFTALAVVYVFGLFLTNYRMVGYDDNPFYYIGQFGSGLTLLLGSFLSGEKASPRPGLPLSWFDVGLLYVCVAGLLNYVVALSCVGLAPRAKSAEVKSEPPATAAQSVDGASKEKPAPATPPSDAPSGGTA